MTYNEGLASLATRARWVRVFMWAFIAISLVRIPVSLAIDYAYYESGIALAVIGVASFGFLAVWLLVAIGCIAVIPAWTYRAWANLHTLGLRGLRRSPAMAAGFFFIPVVNLFEPFTTMRELYNRSTGEDEDHARESVGDVTWWWACFIAGNGVLVFTEGAQVFNRNGVIMIAAHPIVWTLTALFGLVLQIGAAWFLIRTVKAITTAQSAAAGIEQTFA